MIEKVAKFTKRDVYFANLKFIAGSVVECAKGAYRDHQISRAILVSVGLDTSREKRAGLLDQQGLFATFLWELHLNG